MKKLLILVFLWFNLLLSGTTYYVSSAGNDASNGLSGSTSWRTIAKVNSVSFSAGDIIYFAAPGFADKNRFSANSRPGAYWTVDAAGDDLPCFGKIIRFSPRH